MKLALLALAFISASVFAESAHIDVFYYNQADNFIKEVKSNIDVIKNEKELILHEFDASDNTYEQLLQIETAISRNGRLLAVNPVDVNNATAVIDMAKKADAYLVFFNRIPDLHALDSYDKAYYVGSDPRQAGFYQGEAILEYMEKHGSFDKNKDGAINLVLLKGPSNHQDSQTRTNAGLKILHDAKINYKIIESNTGNWSYSSGFEMMTNAIDRNKLEDIELIISNNDAMALGAINALQLNDYNNGNDKYIPIFGIDAIKEAKDAVSKGFLSGTVNNDAQKLAIVTIDLLEALNTNAQLSEIDGIKIEDNRLLNIPYQRYLK